MIMEAVIRPSTPDDAEELAVVHVAAWQAAYPGLVPDDHLRRLDPARNAATRRRAYAAGRYPSGEEVGTELLAQVGNRIAGFVVYGNPRDDVPAGWGEVRAINLHPDFWRRGIGSQLFGAAVIGLRTAGFRYGYLWVLRGNERAIGFYRRHGWPADGQSKNDDRFDPPLVELRCSSRLDSSERN
jgi:ribosomal protein S18 acetylase RimI-like enzyme